MLFLIPCLVVVPMFYGIEGVWMAMPISDAIATVVAAVLMVGLVRRFKKSPTSIGFKSFEEQA